MGEKINSIQFGLHPTPPPPTPWSTPTSPLGPGH